MRTATLTSISPCLPSHSDILYREQPFGARSSPVFERTKSIRHAHWGFSYGLHKDCNECDDMHPRQLIQQRKWCPNIRFIGRPEKALELEDNLLCADLFTFTVPFFLNLFFFFFKFVSVTSFFAFAFAATQTHVETESLKEKMRSLSPVWSVKAITNTDLKRVQNAELIQVAISSRLEYNS